MILKPSDLKKMVADWLAAGYTVDLDLATGWVKEAQEGRIVWRAVLACAPN